MLTISMADAITTEVINHIRLPGMLPILRILMRIIFGAAIASSQNVINLKIGKIEDFFFLTLEHISSIKMYLLLIHIPIGRIVMSFSRISLFIWRKIHAIISAKKPCRTNLG